MRRLACLMRGHPEWRETTIVIETSSLGQQFTSGFLGVPTEIEALIVGGRAWRCVRCHAGRVTDYDRRRRPR